VARETDPIVKAAEAALAARLGESTRVDASGYCELNSDNLVAGITPQIWASASRDLGKGRGDELTHKFRAAYSSAALAVNAFGPLEGTVHVPGIEPVHGRIRFEQARSAWARGYSPTLDVIVETPDASVRLYVESKCIEYLRKTDTRFSSAFPRIAREHLEPSTADVFEAVYEDRYLFDPVDAPQLLKHFLAAKRAAYEHACRVILLCVWWEPTNGDRWPVFERHRLKASDLARRLRDPDVELLAMPYRELWEHWERIGDPALRDHVGVLRTRYVVALDA
jgi:Restriction Endonuclease associating with ARP